jgi:hypothetical protein
MTQELFDGAVEYAEKLYSFQAMWNSSEWSKLALGHIASQVKASTVLQPMNVAQVRSRMQDAMEGNADALQFVLYSGHGMYKVC